MTDRRLQFAKNIVVLDACLHEPSGIKVESFIPVLISSD